MMTGDISPVPWWNRMPFTAWIPKVKPWWVRRMTAPIGLLCLAVLGAPACEGRRKVRWTRSLRIGSGPVGVLAFSIHLLVVAAGDDQSVQVIRLNTRHLSVDPGASSTLHSGIHMDSPSRATVPSG
jgi:hypothetical protein